MIRAETGHNRGRIVSTCGNARRQPGVFAARDYKTQNSVLLGARQLAKRVIVALAVRGLVPAKAAEWLIKHGGLRHA